MSTLESTPRMKFAMITILILWGLGAYMVTGDLCSVPKKNQEWLQEHPEYFIGKKDTLTQIGSGNGISATVLLATLKTLSCGYVSFLDF